MKEYKPREHMMMISATQSELIALGHVVTHYLTEWERQPNKSKDVLEIMALLRSFQGRVVAYSRQQPPFPAPMREVRR